MHVVQGRSEDVKQQTSNPMQMSVDRKEKAHSYGAYVPVGADDDDEAISRLEIGGADAAADEALHRRLRLGFIRKVYGILSLQLALTAAVAACLALVRPAREFVLATPSLTWLGFALSLATLFALMAYKHEHPRNAQLLFVWTLVEAYTVGVVCAAYVSAGQGALIVEALVLTFSVFAVLTLFTFQSKVDWSWLGAGLSSALWVLILWGLFSWMFGIPSGGVYSLFGALIFSGYIIFDTFLITQKFGYDDYIFASVTLYLDLVNLFFFILQMLSQRRE
mmetsp:Transcript_13929/g.41489  ORF Transcript_13929/g.41489 Transcript_13929/m.41489 type:complete len:278 (+) Transcript_13929:160-993(+)